MEAASYNCLLPKLTFDVDILRYLENDLELNEKVSLFFLLYDDVPVAREHIARAVRSRHEHTQIHYLRDWAMSCGAFWRERLVEGLYTIQAYSNIIKMELDLNTIKACFSSENIQTDGFIHPLKKVLYSVCESLTRSNTRNLVSALAKACPNVAHDYVDLEYLEMFLLKLINVGYIKLGFWKIKDIPDFSTERALPSDVNKLAFILKKLKFIELSEALLSTQDNLNGTSKQITDQNVLNLTSYVESAKCSSHTSEIRDNNDVHEINAKNQNESENPLENENNYVEPLPASSEHTPVKNEVYEISSNPIGLLVIINQLQFKNESNPELTSGLVDRITARIDENCMSKTWESLHFTVIVFENIDYDQMLFLVDDEDGAISFMKPEHSVFALCILSHGYDGAILAADGYPLKIERIERRFFSSKAPLLAGKPKILITEICQEIGETPELLTIMRSLEQDGRSHPKSTLPEKCDVFVYRSVIPNCNSNSDPCSGSRFIRCLCDNLDRYADNTDFLEICSNANFDLSQMDIEKIPEITTSFTKRLYLKINK